MCIRDVMKPREIECWTFCMFLPIDTPSSHHQNYRTEIFALKNICGFSKIGEVFANEKYLQFLLRFN